MRDFAAKIMCFNCMNKTIASNECVNIRRMHSHTCCPVCGKKSLKYRYGNCMLIRYSSTPCLTSYR